MAEQEGTSGSVVNQEVSSEQASASSSASQDHTHTVAKHYNQLQESGLEARAQSRIFYLRNFNNWMKSVLIGEYLLAIRKSSQANSSLSVLDLASGKGGDFLKWKKGRVDHLICADIAGTSVEQSENRYKEMVERGNNERFPQKLFTAQFITADCTKVRLLDHYKNSNQKFDLVSCQFSFHYCFESLPQAETMLQNACECLKPGGYFIGTIPNAYELVKRLRASEDNSFGNEVYRVSFLTKDKTDLPLFGCKYDFHLEGVVDCPEFLVYFPVLEKLAEKWGMKLVMMKPFAEFFKENVEKGDHRTLLGKMQALEPYPPDEDVQPVSSVSSDYEAAKLFIEQLRADAGPNSRSPKIGTLSQAEWEAVTVYCAFAFQKQSESLQPAQSRKRPAAPENEPSHSKEAKT